MRYVPLPELIVVFVSANAVVFEPARAIRGGQWIGRNEVTQLSRQTNGCVLARSQGLRAGQFLGELSP